MNCAYHTYNAANVNCNGCGKPLCPACDHRIKGFPYCQDCIVQGVEMLRQQNQTSHAQFVKSQTSPFFAFVLSICPGLGAAYNGQTLKALTHFGIAVGMLQLMLQNKMAIFFFGFLGIWAYSAVDAWKTARMIRRGVTTESADSILTQRFSGNLKIWALVLVGIGILFFLDVRFLMSGLLPIMLIGLGVYILRMFVFKSRDDEVKYPDFSNREGAPNYIGAVGRTDFRDDSFEAEYDSTSRQNVRGWKNR